MSTAQISQPEAVDGAAIYRKITLRLIPYMFLLYILAYLDRVNVGYAAAQMKADLHMSDAVYGTGAGLFFIGSALFDIPSNLILAKVGPRRWMSRIMITWGIVATCMSLVHSAHAFYARSVSRFMTATAVAGVVGGPIAASLLSLDGSGGLHGWQWLFIAEGIPTMLAGVSVLFILKEHPREAKWLGPKEQEWLEQQLTEDREQLGTGEHKRFTDAFKLPALYPLAAVFIACQVGVYVINLWLPLFLKATAGVIHMSSSGIDRWSTVPYLITAIAMVLVGYSSDRNNDRRWHVSACMLCSAIGFVAAVYAHSFALILVAFTLATIGVFSVQGPFWTWLTSMLEGTAAAGGIAIITCVGGLGAFLGQFTVGRLSVSSHSYTSGLFTVAGVALAGAIAALFLKNTPSQPEQTHAAPEIEQ
jgi:ACS family tartrate transporter-like MFS transporter